MKRVLIILWIIIFAGAYFILKAPEDKPNPQGSNTTEIDLADIDLERETPLPLPTTVKGFLQLADKQLRDNEPKLAEESFLAALAIDPDSIEAGIGVVQAKLNQRDIKTAREKLFDLPPENQDVLYYEAIIDVLYKEFPAAESTFREIAEGERFRTDLKEKAAVFVESFRTFSYFLEGDENFLKTMLAQNLTQNGQFEAAIPLLFDVINSQNNYRDAWIVLGYAYLNTGKNLDAIDALEQAKALDSEKPEIHFYLGLARFAENQIDEAVINIKRAQDLGHTPENEIFLKLGELYTIQGNYEEAHSQYSKLTEVDPENINFFIRIVWLNIEKLARPVDAIQFAQQAVTNHPESAMSHNLLGWAYIANEEYEKALTSLKKSLEIDPKLDVANLNIASVYETRGQNDLAAEYYKRAYALGKDTSIGAIAKERYRKITNKNLQLNVLNTISP